MSNKVKALPTPARVAKQIEKRNKEFAAADDAGKRVLVAKDVIKLLKGDKFTAATGHFMSLGNDVDYADSEREESMQKTGLREAFLGNHVECSGCALGGLMLSCTLYNNKYTYGELSDTGGDLGAWVKNERPIKNGLNKIFSRDQLKLIEQSFEGGTGYFTGGAPYEAEVFYGNYDDDKKRLLAIMENIVRNKGTFVP